MITDTKTVLVILGNEVLDDMGTKSHSHLLSSQRSPPSRCLMTQIAVVSLILFWPMIQMGVALIAACLPTLRPVFHDFSPESVIRSLRSKLSLHSTPSKSSIRDESLRVSHESESTKAFAPKGISADEYFGHNEYTETHIMANVRNDRCEGQPATDKICVQRDLRQVAEIV